MNSFRKYFAIMLGAIVMLSFAHTDAMKKRVKRQVKEGEKPLKIFRKQARKAEDGVIMAWVEGTGYVARKRRMPEYFSYKPQSKKVIITTKKNFESADNKNYYKILAIPSLQQRHAGPCGYYALWNTHCLRHGKPFLNRKKFNELHERWQKITKIKGEEYLETSQILDLIPKAGLNLENNEENIVIINPLGEVMGYRKSTKKRYSRLQQVTDDFKNGEPIYLIAHTGDQDNKRIELFPGSYDKLKKAAPDRGEDALKDVAGVELRKSDWIGKKHSIADKHWIAMSFEWAGTPGKSPVEIRVLDSWAEKDNRYTDLIHYYYWLLIQRYN